MYKYTVLRGCRRVVPGTAVPAGSEEISITAYGPAVISSPSWGVFAVTAGGLGLRRGHVIYRGVVAVAAVRAVVVSGCCPSFGLLDGLG